MNDCIVLYGCIVMDDIITAIFPDVGLIPSQRGVNCKHHPHVAKFTIKQHDIKQIKENNLFCFSVIWA